MWNMGTMFLICLPISNWAEENLHVSGFDRLARNPLAGSISFVSRFFSVLISRSTSPFDWGNFELLVVEGLTFNS